MGVNLVSSHSDEGGQMKGGESELAKGEATRYSCNSACNRLHDISGWDGIPSDYRP